MASDLNYSSIESLIDKGLGLNNPKEPINSDVEMLSVEEANEIEETLLKNVGYTPAKGDYPIVYTNQTTFYSKDSIMTLWKRRRILRTRCNL